MSSEPIKQRYRFSLKHGLIAIACISAALALYRYLISPTLGGRLEFFLVCALIGLFSGLGIGVLVHKPVRCATSGLLLAFASSWLTYDQSSTMIMPVQYQLRFVDDSGEPVEDVIVNLTNSSSRSILHFFPEGNTFPLKSNEKGTTTISLCGFYGFSKKSCWLFGFLPIESQLFREPEFVIHRSGYQPIYRTLSQIDGESLPAIDQTVDVPFQGDTKSLPVKGVGWMLHKLP